MANQAIKVGIKKVGHKANHFISKKILPKNAHFCSHHILVVHMLVSVYSQLIFLNSSPENLLLNGSFFLGRWSEGEIFNSLLQPPFTCIIVFFPLPQEGI